jgi:small multidrug resistance family-3 protein
VARLQGGREHRGWLWAIAGSLAWGMIADGFRPDRWDVAGAIVSLIGVGLIMYAPR